MNEYTKIYERACKYANRKSAENGEYNDRDIIYYAKWFLDRYKELFDFDFTHFGIESVSLNEADKSAYYLNQGDTYAETVICSDGKAYVGCYGDWVEETEANYCKNEDKIRCAACSEFSDFDYDDGNTDSTECTYCEDHYVDGTEIPSKGSQLNGCIELEDGDYGMLWIDYEPIETDNEKSRHTSILVQLQYTEYYDSEWAADSGKYHVEVLAVTPGIVSKEARKSLLDTIGLTQEDWNGWDHNTRCAVCVDTGTHAVLWQETSNDANALLCEAEKQRQAMHLLIGFKLDGPQNAIGTSGWDFMRGNIFGGLKSCND